MKKLTFLIDIDNTICITKGNDYKNSKPIYKKIYLLNSLYEKGHIIKFFTSRFMGRSFENASKAKIRGFDFTKKQLKQWGCKYNDLIMGKPSYDISIDDKSLFYSKRWDNKLRKKYF
jgi:hypothetical protein